MEQAHYLVTLSKTSQNLHGGMQPKRGFYRKLIAQPTSSGHGLNVLMTSGRALDATFTWLGAPPIAEGRFAFANGDFFAETSGQKRHRRATVGELKEHFSSGTDKDHPAHWFEAQLVHYGLKPSKTKSVARMRLFDAVNRDNLAVPSDLVELEAKLRKEWAKNDKAVRAGKIVNGAKKVAGTQKPVMSKRKASGGIIPKDTKKAKPTTAASHDTLSQTPLGPRSADTTSKTPVPTSHRSVLQGTRRGALLSTEYRL